MMKPPLELTDDEVRQIQLAYWDDLYPTDYGICLVVAGIIEERTQALTENLARVIALRDELLAAGSLITTRGQVGLRLDAALRGEA